LSTNSVQHLRDKNLILGIAVGWCVLVLWSVARWHGRISKVHARGLNAAMHEFLKYKRSLDILMLPSGHLSKANIIQESSSIHKVVYRSRRRNLYRYLFEVCFLKAFSSVMFTGLVSLTLVWVLVDALYEKRFDLRVLLENVASCLRLFEVVMPLVALLLALYVQLRLARARSVVKAVQAVQDVIEELALVVGTYANRSYGKPEVKEVLWSLFRMLNLVHIQVYYKVLDRHSKLANKHICYAGFITAEELKILEASADQDSTAMLWTCQLLNLMVEMQALDIQVAGAVLKMIPTLRKKTSQLLQEITRTPSRPLLQLMQFLCDIVCLWTPPALVFDFVSGRTVYDVVVPLARMKIPENAAQWADHLLDKSRLATYLVPTVCSMVIAFFFQGSLTLVHETQHVFEIGIDSLNPASVLGDTERRILSFLNEGPPFHMPPITLRSAGQDAKSVVDKLLSQHGSETMSEVGGAPSEISVGASSRLSRASSCAAPDIYGKAQVVLGQQMLHQISADADLRTMELQRHALGAVAYAAAAAAKDSAAEVKERPKTGELELLEMLFNASRENARLREQLIGALGTGRSSAEAVDAASAAGSSAASMSGSDYEEERRR